AKSLGIDSLFTNGMYRGDFSHVFDLLKLPEKYCFPLIALVLGYANQELSHLRGRLTGPCIVHRGEYHTADKDELRTIVQPYDDPDTNLELPIPWKEKGFEHFLDWFFEVWTSRAPMGKGRSQLFEWLIKTGFLSGDVD
ncbi:nitroreductase, partial [Candidatus Bipolaricaulota bacterium]|nr:nitroreductase [Candidatus Bipolaricaulota bacterium]